MSRVSARQRNEGDYTVPPRREDRDTQWRQKWKRRWRQGIAELWQFVYRARDKTGQTHGRLRQALGAVTILILLAASAYLSPTLQTNLETWVSTDGAVQRVQSLILGTGTALIGAAAIVASLVLFAMQVNVERMPHGLFRRLSADAKLLGAFASAFGLAITVAVLSTVTEKSTMAVVLVATTWAILSILGLFLYAYRRALRLINPLEQLQILVDDSRDDLRRWARRADRVTPLFESESETESAPLPHDPTHDLERTIFFDLYPHWTAGARKGVEQAMAFARRYAERADYEVAGGALTAIVAINAAYVAAKGKTFYANALFLENPRARDAFVTETLEYLRQSVDRAIGRRDERQIEQSMQVLAALVQVYLGIDYASRTAEKTHAHLAAGYLGKAVEAVVPHEMTDVLMEGQHLMGRAARQFVGAGSVTYSVGLSARIVAFASTGCAQDSYRPVTMEGMRELADLTLTLLRSPSYQVGYALGKVREQVSQITKQFLHVPDTPLANIHGSTLGPYFSSSDMQSLREQLTDLVNRIRAAGPDDADAQRVIRNLEQWADGLHGMAKDVLLQAIWARSHFTIHMFQWIQGITELLLATSNARACDHHSQLELRNHARRLIATLSLIPEDEETVKWVESYQVTETLFRAAIDGRRHGRDEHAEAVGRDLLAWAFKGGRYIAGYGVLKVGLCGCAALALTGHAGATDALKNHIVRYLGRDRAPEAEVLAQAADGIRRQAAELGGPNYATSAIEDKMSEIDDRTLAPLLREIADMLSPQAR